MMKGKCKNTMWKGKYKNTSSMAYSQFENSLKFSKAMFLSIHFASATVLFILVDWLWAPKVPPVPWKSTVQSVVLSIPSLSQVPSLLLYLGLGGLPSEDFLLTGQC